MLHISNFGSCFQFELDETAKTWNRHDIRQSGNNSLPFGRPDVIFYAPELWQTQLEISYILFKIQILIWVLKEQCFVLYFPVVRMFMKFVLA